MFNLVIREFKLKGDNISELSDVIYFDGDVILHVGQHMEKKGSDVILLRRKFAKHLIIM